MLDVGLLATGVAIWLVLAAAHRLTDGSSDHDDSPFDRLALPAVTGLLAGRAVAAALDDPTSLRSVRSFLVIRGGVEFWPGVAVTVAVLVIAIRRRHGAVVFELAELVPFLLWGYAAYEAACVLRDGCYGPASALGLVPQGLHTRVLPLGLLVGAAVAALGLLLHRLWQLPPALKVAMAIAGVAAARSIASIWLPHLGGGLTRQHRESVAIATVATGISVALLGREATRRRRARLVVSP